ncbi:helix-turn-helix transcriptional regulator [Megasphaera sp.]|uniref:helix-turn-helix domain-containing protein n=1 Tax=Megasphaera sp. TaxID=2023260 RepID=UPI002057A715|nr:helix-turn-helix transcriptional regulator [Megasphaera sp.]DAU35628.1 MAG TPA: helix-turn-helix domain protein [Caudoviricetes sp.]
MSFGEKLKSCRKNMRLNQKEFGQKIGVAESTVSLYESNKRFPDADTLKKIANLFDVSLDYLLGNVKSNHAAEGKMPKDLNKFLQQSEIIFDGDTYNLTDEDRDLVMKSLEVAFLAAKRANKRKKGDTPTK